MTSGDRQIVNTCTCKVIHVMHQCIIKVFVWCKNVILGDVGIIFHFYFSTHMLASLNYKPNVIKNIYTVEPVLSGPLSYRHPSVPQLIQDKSIKIVGVCHCNVCQIGILRHQSCCNIITTELVITCYNFNHQFNS